MSYDAKAVANEFLKKAKESGDELNPMQIQKLVYIAHGWSLVILKKPLIKDRIEAWDYGPVIPSLYHEFKKFGSGPIKEAAKEWPSGSIPSMSGCSSEVRELIDRVWDVYRHMDALALSRLTHQADSPWALTKQRIPVLRSVPIPDELIRQHYTRKARQNEQRRRTATAS